LIDDLTDASALIRWHGMWLAIVVGAGALATLLVGALPSGAYISFTALVGAGLLGMALSHHPRLLLFVWSIAAAFAAGGAGGLIGPGAAWILLPFAAAAAFARPAREAAAMSVAVALSAYLADALAVSPGAVQDDVRWAAIAMAALATTAWAWISGGRLHEVGVAHVALDDTGPREAARAHALALELETTRALTAQAEDARAQAEAGRAQAQAANQAKSRFLANMSHELRTPLNAVMGFADIMRNRLFGPMPDRYAEYAQLIHESGAHLLGLINDVLDMSKIEGRPLPPSARGVRRARGGHRRAAPDAHPGRRGGRGPARRVAGGRRDGRRRQARAEADRAQPAVQRAEVHALGRGGDRDPRRLRRPTGHHRGRHGRGRRGRGPGAARPAL
jgi:signal transduction histidine kinase